MLLLLRALNCSRQCLLSCSEVQSPSWMQLTAISPLKACYSSFSSFSSNSSQRITWVTGVRKNPYYPNWLRKPINYSRFWFYWL